MTDTAHFTNLRSLMTSLSRAMSLVNPEMEHHHEQTAYLAYFIARSMGLSEDDRLLALYGAMLHDIGSVVVDEPQSVVEIERNAREVALTGAGMLEEVQGFHEVAKVVGLCQCPWEDARIYAEKDDAVCTRLLDIASIIHLADLVSLGINPNERVLNQVNSLCEMAQAASGSEFNPAAVQALLDLSGSEFIWMDVVYNPDLLFYFTGEITTLSLDETVALTAFMSHIVDYRSPFTAMHSAGVAASARELARLAGMCENDVKKMEIAGNLHDIGKLAVPRAILEKPGKLTNEEFNIVKEHPYYTSYVLLGVEGFSDIAYWAARHHEKLNGRGYPFHFGGDELSTGDRIMAVADIFSAITEERPYRPGMTREKASAILKEDVESGAICGDIVNLLMENYELVDAARDKSSRTAGKRYFSSIESQAGEQAD